ncbi:putative quinol monooxygenase [Actinoplanes sp. L3-i22]|uniref:putative quinol monooxygenase n=1 Tax=Actinoplanes sp. L3-i22 TaxID=2836373 RepID=UPI001C861986|nr:antibiotic biosynthesis monooxygenase [Actinoplanes sp. L3-i22]
MSTEVAFFSVRPGSEEQFLAVFRDEVAALLRAGGATQVAVYRSQVAPNRFVKTSVWPSRRARVEDFVASPHYQRFLALMGPYLDGPPGVDDYDLTYSQ